MWLLGRIFTIAGSRLNRVCCASFKGISRQTMSESIIATPATQKREIYDTPSPAKKIKIDDEILANAEIPPPVSVNDNVEVHKAKLKKMVMLISYSGKGYTGMQRNPGIKTIEEDLMLALYKSDIILRDHYDLPQLIHFQRAARTDKGVSAVKQIVSLKLPAEETKVMVEKINENLPPQIKVIALKRTTKGFNSKLTCDARTYAYMLPTFAFAACDELTSETYRIPDSRIEEVNNFLQLYLGTHNYHNFTSGRKADDPSSKRYIMSCRCGESFVRDEIEFVVIKIKGQSFMLHQIRKMVGLSIAVMRNLANEKTLHKAWTHEKLDLPIAPGLGLMLEEVHYDKYNRRYGGDGIHDPLVWDEYQDVIYKFREEQIYPTIFETERKEKSMLNWLSTLMYHTFDVRNPERPDTAGEITPTSETENQNQPPVTVVSYADDKAAPSQDDDTVQHNSNMKEDHLNVHKCVDENK